MDQKKYQEERKRGVLEVVQRLEKALKTTMTQNKELSKELEMLNGDIGFLVLMLCDQGEMMGRMMK